MPKMYPASFNQKQLKVFAELHPQSRSYNINFPMSIQQPYDVALLQRCFQVLAERHEVLRTTFSEVNGELMQVVHEARAIPVEVIPVSSWDDATVRQEAAKRSDALYDFENGPLMHAHLFIRPSKTVLVICMHHIVWDAWSISVFIEEFDRIYTALKNNQLHELPHLNTQYKDFAYWQQAFLQSPRSQQQLMYWQKKLATLTPWKFPILKPTLTGKREYHGAVHGFRLDVTLMSAVMQLTKTHHITSHMFLLTIYGLLLHRYMGSENVAISTPKPGRLRMDDNRQRLDFSDNIGYFVNPVLLLMQFSPQETFLQALQGVIRLETEARDNQDYPLTALAESVKFEFSEINFNYVRSKPGSHFSIAPFIANIADYQLPLKSLTLESFYIRGQQADAFDLGLICLEHSNEIYISMTYRTDLFTSAQVTRMAGHFVEMVKAIVDNPAIKVADIPLMTVMEKQQVLIDFNRTHQFYPQQQTVHGLIEQQAQLTPQAIAAIFEDQQLTYRELSVKANTLAAILREHGVKPNDLVVLMVEQSLDIVVGILAILKAGGAYLPIDPQYPATRIEYLLKDSAAKVVLTQSTFINKLSQWNYAGRVIDLKDPGLYRGEIAALQNVNTPHDLIYTIYTSGSTGLPKGAMLTHRNALNYLCWAIDYYKLHQGCGAPLHSSLAFDLTVTSIFTPLLTGKTVHIVADGFAGLADLLAQQPNFSLVKLTPAHLRLLQNALSPTVLAKLTSVFVIGGEALYAEDVQFLRSHAPHVRIINEYGPTETTVGCCIYEVDTHTPSSGSLSIGRPIANTQLYVLDQKRQPLPLDIAGELYIGGDSVGAGYRNRVALTNEKFVVNPFSAQAADRLYKTGDLVKWTEAGLLTYLGRNDHQVKVRGYRIELGEIETAITRNELVKECVVTTYSDQSGEKQLAAYVVMRESYTQIEERNRMIDKLNQQLKNQLPSYMIPTYWALLEKLPLTVNGKINREALPVPEKHQIISNANYVAPRTPAEQQLAAIWRELLRVPQVSIHDSFFELGGDSIIGIQMLSRAKKIGIQFKMKQFVESPTIAHLAALAQATSVQSTQCTNVNMGNSDDIPLTPIQHWFFNRRLPNPNHYKMSLPLLEAKGCLNIANLEASLQILVRRHDSLQMRYRYTQGVWKQSLHHAEEKISCVVYDFTGLPTVDQLPALQKAAQALQATLNIDTGPIFKAGLFQTTQHQYLLLFAHHLVIDGVSWRILLEELQQIYLQLTHQQEVSLSPSTTTFQEWAIALQSYAQSPELAKELPRWLNQSSNGAALKLPRDFQPDSQVEKNNKIGELVVPLNPIKTKQLLQDVPKAYQTQINDVLLTALVLAMRTLTGKQSLYLSLESHGRADVIEGIDLSRTIGWFTAIFPVYLTLDNVNVNDIAQTLKTIQQQLRDVPHQGIGYGLLKYLRTVPDTNLIKVQPTPEVIFNYFGQMDDRINNQSGLFNFTQERTKRFISNDNPPAALIDIQAVVLNGSLSTFIFYDTSAYQEGTILRLAQSFVTTLETLIDHCLQKIKADMAKNQIFQAHNPVKVTINNNSDSNRAVIRAKL